MIKNILYKFVNMVYKWHWFWFKHHLDWLMNDYKTEAWQAIDKAVKQVLESTARVGSIVEIKGDGGELIRDLKWMKYCDSKYSYDIPEHDRKMAMAFYKMVVEPLRKWFKDEKYENSINERR